MRRILIKCIHYLRSRTRDGMRRLWRFEKGDNLP
nr:MAG TPA: hypothetical protein [Caudoviricetes sp.]